MLEEEARPDGGRQGLGEHRGAAVFLVRPEPHLDRVEILEAEAAAEDGGVGEVLLRLVGQPGGPALDQRAHRRREQARGVLGERPRAVDLLDHPQLPVRPGELFHDEGDTLRLRVHRRRARDVDLPAEHLLRELGRLQLREPFEPEAAHHAHALHVGDERHGFRDLGQLLGACREPQEDGEVGVGADDVAQHPHAVLVGPLEIVDEQRYGLGLGQRADGAGGEIEHAQELLIRGERVERGIVATRDGIDDPLELLSCSVGAVPPNGRRGEDPAGEEKRAPDLLVGHRRQRHEAFGRRSLRSGDEQPRLADAGLTLERERRQPPGPGRRELLPDRAELDLPPDHGAGRPPDVEGQRRHRGRGRIEGSLGVMHGAERYVESGRRG